MRIIWHLLLPKRLVYVLNLISKMFFFSSVFYRWHLTNLLLFGLHSVLTVFFFMMTSYRLVVALLLALTASNFIDVAGRGTVGVFMA